jgi:phage shock protein E
MDWTWFIAIVPLTFAVGFLVFQKLGQVSAAEAYRLVEGGARLIDVRTSKEFASGHLPGAISIPLQELQAREGELGGHENAIVVYCAAGPRSALARTQLRRRGFKRVFDLGAMHRWERRAPQSHLD